MIYYEIFNHNKPKSYINLQNTAKNYDSSSISPPKHIQMTFLLLKEETSRLRHFEAFEYSVQKKVTRKTLSTSKQKFTWGFELLCI